MDVQSVFLGLWLVYWRYSLELLVMKGKHVRIYCFWRGVSVKSVFQAYMLAFTCQDAMLYLISLERWDRVLFRKVVTILGLSVDSHLEHVYVAILLKILQQGAILNKSAVIIYLNDKINLVLSPFLFYFDQLQQISPQQLLIIKLLLK